jgi:hypothetical protein
MGQELTVIPTVRDTVDQNFLLEPLNGPQDVIYYLGRFPEEIYHKSPDSHLYKFMRAMLGENGVNWVKKNYLEARLLLEEIGIDLFDLDRFYGNIFQFGRIVEESFDDDPYGLIDKDTWEKIKAKNTRYRNRAMDFITGARAGNTPYGMRLVAKSGLGHDVEIHENYKYLYDLHSDDPLGLERIGKTTSTEEMIILPRREVGDTTESSDEVYEILPQDQYHLQQAVDRIRPQTTIMTLASARGVRQRTNWVDLYATSEYTEVVRYVTGNPNIQWPQPDLDHPTLWIESQVEKEAPRIANDLQHHHTSFHDSSITASSEELTADGTVPASRALAEYPNPLLVSSTTELANGKLASFIDGIYPTEYESLPGAQKITYRTNQYWSSLQRAGEESLTLAFNELKGVNYVSFDIAKAPVEICIEYDAYDEDTSLYVGVTPTEPYSNIISEDAQSGQNPWASLGLTFTNRQGNIILTRSLKLRFIRLGDYEGSIQVKNLRAGRNV